MYRCPGVTKLEGGPTGQHLHLGTPEVWKVPGMAPFKALAPVGTLSEEWNLRNDVRRWVRGLEKPPEAALRPPVRNPPWMSVSGGSLQASAAVAVARGPPRGDRPPLGAPRTHQRGRAHSEALLVNRPGRGVEHDHPALAQGAPQLGVRVADFLRRVEVPWGEAAQAGSQKAGGGEPSGLGGPGAPRTWRVQQDVHGARAALARRRADSVLQRFQRRPGQGRGH